MTPDQERKIEAVAKLLKESKEEICQILGIGQERALQRIQEAATIGKIKAVYYAAPEDSEAKQLTVEKLLQLV